MSDPIVDPQTGEVRPSPEPPKQATVKLSTAERTLLGHLDAQVRQVLTEALQIRGINPEGVSLIDRNDERLILEEKR